MSQSITTSETLTNISNSGATYNVITISSGVTLSLTSTADSAINNSNQFSTFLTGTNVSIYDNGGFENINFGNATFAGNGTLSLGATDSEALNNSKYGSIFVGTGEVISDAGGGG